MNRRRALISYEMRNMKWVLLIAVLGSLFFVLNLFGRVGNGAEILLWYSDIGGYFGSCFSNELLNLLHDYHIYIWLLFAVIVTMQFRDFHKKKTEEYMSSLPFTARERFLTKSLIGYAVIAVSWILLSAGTLIVRQNVITQYHKQALLFPFYKEMIANETIWHTLRTLGLFGLEMLAVYALFLLIHLIVNKGVAASVITLGIMMAPFELLYVASGFELLVNGGSSLLEDRILRPLAGIFLGDSLAFFTNEQSLWEYNGTYQNYYYISYPETGLAVLLLLVIILICSAITWRLSKGHDMTKNNVLVSYKGARIFLSAGIGLCFGGAAAVFLPLLMFAIRDSSIVAFIANWLFATAFFGFVSWKLLSLSIR